ncbi:MAG: hypothetical protein GX242_00735 [Clostridiales bacterium]|nr:hypothetical protein [Clostridiales bacterium]
MRNTSCKTKKNKDNGMHKIAKVIFALGFSLLMVCVALFGGAALGNKDIVDTVLETEAAENLQAAEAGSAAGGGKGVVALRFASLGTHNVNTTFSTSNVYWTSYYSGNSHGNQMYCGAGYFGNGGSGTVRQKVTISSASTNFAFTAGSVADNLQKKGLLQVKITATIRSKNGYDGDRKVAYKKGSSTMNVDTGSSLLSGFITIASRTTNGNNQTQSGTVTFNLGANDKYICLAAGGYCNYTSLIGGRYPGQQAESISFQLISRDTSSPSFYYPNISGWAKTERSVQYTVNDNVQVDRVYAYRSGSSITPTISKTTENWNVSFFADYRYTYYISAYDTSNNYNSSSTWSYTNFKLDGYAPKILRVLFVRAGATSILVGDGLSSSKGQPWSGSVRCFIEVEDYQSTSNYSSGTIYSSGIASVKYNGTTCNPVPNNSVQLPIGTDGAAAYNKTVNTIDGKVGKGWYEYPYSIDSNFSSASVEVLDDVGFPASKTVSLYYIDKVAPVVESAVVTRSNGSAIPDGSTWFNAPATLKITVIDYATNGNLSYTRSYAAGITNIKLETTRFSRNAARTGAGSTTAINISFNPTSSTSTSGSTNGDGSAFMRRTSYVSSTCSVGGVTYYCYRYIIEVPILYQTDYKFTFTDKSGNARTSFRYNHLSDDIDRYKPNIDETAPQFTNVMVEGFAANGASLGNARNDYVSASYLVFKVTANDQSFTGRNDGSGVKRIQILSGATVLSEKVLSTPLHAVVQQELYVYHTSHSGSKDSTFVRAIDINSCVTSTYRIRVIDEAGNSTDMTPSAATGSMQINPNASSALDVSTLVDNITPTLSVYMQNQSTLIKPSTATYAGNSSTRVYEFDWTAVSQSIHIKFTFGCSGATVYRYNNSLSDANRVAIDISAAGGTYNKNNNSKSINETYSSEGINHYSFKIVNGAKTVASGKGAATDTAGANYTIIVIKVKVDKTAPSYELLGFGTTIAAAGKNDLLSIKNSIENANGPALNENLLTQANSYYGTSFYAYYYVKDTHMTTEDNRQGTSWLSGGQAKARVTVKHANYSHSYDVGYDLLSNNKFTLLAVQMYDLPTLRLMKHKTSGASIYNASQNIYDLTYGQNVIYNIEIRDAVGNARQIKLKEQSTELSYNVDPFPLSSTVIQVPKDTTYGYDYYGDYRNAIENGWTKLSIKYTITKQTSISPVVVEYRLVPIKDANTANPTPVGSSDQYPYVPVGDLGSASTATFILSPQDGSRCAFVEFRIYKSYAKYNHLNDSVTKIDYKDLNGNNKRYIIKQDVDVPELTAVYFSRSPNAGVVSQAQALANPSIVAYFKATNQDGNYTYTRLTPEKAVWTYEQLYMYVIASDSLSGSGAGVRTVVLYNQDGTGENAIYQCDANTVGGSFTGEQVFRSNRAIFGYLNATNNNPISFRLIDYAPEPDQNATSQIAINTDSSGNRVLPRVDTATPRISVTAASHGGGSYLRDGKLPGDATTQSLSITLSFTWGASGAKIYRVDMQQYFKASYDTDPWGFGKNFAGTTKVSGTPTSLSGMLSLQEIAKFSVVIPASTPAGTSPRTATYTDYLSNDIETRSRYYYFIVSNVNEYADSRPIGYVAAGDIFIDNKKPVIHAEHSCYTSKTSGQVMNINTTYTNDEVLAYLFVSDGASGVADVYLKNGSIANTKAAYEASGTKLTYVGSDSRGEQYKFDAMTNNIAYQFIVFDNAGNYEESTAVIPKIDKVVPKITISAKKVDGSSHRIDFANNFTNSPYLQITLTIELGLSKLGALSYNIDGSENYVSITNLRDKDGKAITLTQNGNNSVAVFNINQNGRYKFKATNNVPAQFSKSGVAPTAKGEMYVAIDVTKPSLNENNAAYREIKTVWHHTPKNLVLDAADNTGGSGIDIIHVYYTVGGRSYDKFFKYNEASQKFETYTEQGGEIVFGGDFALSEFVTYNIEITDKAGNKSQTYKIRPNLDQLTPSFNSSYQASTMDGVYNGGSLSSPNWTKHNVVITLSPKYTMSGARVEVAIRNNASGANWGNWINIKDFAWNNNPPLDSDAGAYDSLGNEFTYLIKPDVGKKSVNAYYKFRIVSNAGLVYEDEKVMLVQIDQEVPEFSNQTNISYINSNNVSTTIALDMFNSTEQAFAYQFADNEWTSRNVSITPRIATTPASGITLEFALFNVNTDKWNAWSECQSNPFVHNSDTAGISYKFRYISGSQIASKELIVKAIKVDTKAPVLALMARTSFEGITNPDGSFAQAPQSVFNNGQPYTTTWTNARYVVIRVNAEFGFSGIDITFLKDGTRIAQNDISIAYGESGELYYYIPYSVNLRVNAKSKAGLTGFVDREIRIDNLLPELYVSEIRGTKSTNWDNTIDNSWFTSNVYFQFGIGTYKNKTGTLERNVDTNGNAIAPPSGFRIEYRIKTTDGYTSWTDTNSTTSYGITTMEVVEGRIYNFRIVSGSGMVHELGKDIVYNNEVVATAQAVYDNARANHPNAIFSHLLQDRYDYLINLDQNTYYLDVTQNIRFFDGANVQDSFSNDYARYSYEIFVDGRWIPKQQHDRGNDYEYFHGDLIKLTYQANYDQGKYLHRYTDYIEYYDTVKDGVSTRNTVSLRTFTSGNFSEENAGAIEFRFTKYNYSIESYFKQELTATYTDKVAYVQSYRQTPGATFASKVDIKYYYKQGNDNVSISLGTELSYKNMQTNQVQQGNISIYGNDSLGGYMITAMLDHEVNRESFIIKNPNDILLVKYFTLDGSNPYKINDQNDLEMISSYYYDSYNAETLTLNEKVTYLSGKFIQLNDIALSAEFEPIGEFSGSYNGNGKTITFASVTEADSTFGLFTAVCGSVNNLAEVSNLAISVPHLIVNNAKDVGILAGSIENARINNIWISAKLTIDTALSNANIGGLAGYTNNAQIGAFGPNFIDVRMYHNGNALGNVIAQGTAIGGVVGNAGQNTYLFNTYTFGSMEIYGVESSIDAGAVIGVLAAYLTEGNVDNFFADNYYLKGNAFVNGVSVDNFVGRDNSVRPVVSATRLLYSDFVQLSNTIVGRTIRDSILLKLYADFGMEVREEDSHFVYANGLGTPSDMLMISTVDQLETINEYVMLNYKLAGDIDMTGFNQSIAANKVFTGVLDGKNGQDAMLTNFTGGIYQGYYGLFANLDGTVQNIVFDDLKIDIEYADTDNLYMGLVAAKSYANANVNNIIAIGIVKIDAPYSNVVAGGLVGQAQFGYIYNIFNMANIKVTAKELSLGGIVGQAAGTVLVNYEDVSDAIFSLARVEGIHTGFGDVGAIVGSGSVLEVMSDMQKVFALLDNTYTNGSLNNRTVGSSTVNSAVLTTFGNTAMRSVAVSDGNLFNEVFVTRNLYPLQGISQNLSSTVGADLDNPFKISTEEDFKYINNALYAYYRIVAPNNRIMFNNFETIGEGLFFTGRIDGKTAESGSAEEGEVVSLDGVSDALIYYNLGSISDLSINVNYTKTLQNNQNADFGTVAKYNKGTIRNVIVSGDIVINGGNSVTVSGFVGVDYGGTIDNSSIKNSISSVNITVNRANTIYIGGYVGKVTGTTTVSFAIGQGNINIVDCPSYYAGWLIGRVEGSLDIDLSIIQSYAYTINIAEDGVSYPPIVSTIENYTGINKN